MFLMENDIIGNFEIIRKIKIDFSFFFSKLLTAIHKSSTYYNIFKRIIED